MKVLTVGVFLCLSIHFAFGTGNERTMRTYLRPLGSVPPGESFFRCVDKLDGKAYSDASVRDCRSIIAALPFIRDVHISRSDMEDGRILVEFVATAPSLEVKDMTFDIPQEEEARLRGWLSSNPNLLQVGKSFTRDAESFTYTAVERFYLTQGILVGIVPTINLDFHTGKAKVNFQIIRGPIVPSLPAIPPYGPECGDPVTAIVWSGADDHVPRTLVESLIQLHSTAACYTSEAAQHDQATLNTIGILDESSTVDYTPLNGHRQITFKLRGKPLAIRKIALQGYGSPGACLANAKKSLTLKQGETYSRSNANKSVEYLSKVCSQQGYWTDVREQVELSAAKQVEVTFHVLVVPLQTVLIDGSKVETR